MTRRDALGILSSEEREALEAAAVDLGHDRRQPLASLIQGWADHVERLVAERDVDPDQSGRWTPDDLVAAFHIRDFVDRGLRDLAADLTAAAHRAVDPVDRELRKFTAPDSQGLLRRWLAEERLGDGWWWGRVPVAGPVAHDLLDRCGRSS